MLKANNSRIFLTTLLLVFAFFLQNPTTAIGSVIDESVDGMSGFRIIDDDRVWLDITNENIFGKTYGEMDTWATANGWRFATDTEFMELLEALVPTFLYSSATYDDTVTGHFNQNEADIMGANIGPGGPPEEIQFFTAFINDTRDGYAGYHNERHIGVFEQDDDSGNFHSYWGVDEHAPGDDIIYYGYESALLIKDEAIPGIPEPATVLLFGLGLFGLVIKTRSTT